MVFCPGADKEFDSMYLHTCSEHFKIEQIMMTFSGTKKIAKGTVPTIFYTRNESLEAQPSK